MQRLIIDSSVIVKWLNQTNEQSLEQADEILSQAREDKVELFAPELAKYEIGNVLITKQIAPEDVIISLATLYSIPITFVAESENLAKQTYGLAFKLGLTYYDASFISLAKQYDATLITENIKHQGKSSEIKVKSLKSYK